MTRRLLTLLLLLVPALALAQAAPSADAARLRALYVQRNYETAIIEGAKLTAPDPEARAWFIISLTRGNREKEAIDLVEKMTAELPNNGWAWLAMASVRNYQGDHTEEAIKASEKALALMPNHHDAFWIRASTLSADVKRRDEAIALLDSKLAMVRNPAQLLVAKAYAYYVQGFGRIADAAKLALAFDTFAEARKADPTNVDAHYLAGTYLSSQRRIDEAFPLLKQAAALAPDSNVVQQAYWRAIMSKASLTAEQKAAEIQPAIAAFLEKNSNRPGSLYAASSVYGELKLTDKQRELENIVLDKYADSIDAEWILAYRWREFRGPDDSKKPEYKQTLATYLARPKHYHEGLLGEAYRNMVSLLVTDKTVNPAELKRMLDGMIKYETTNVHITHASVPVTMADNKVLLEEAERIARSSMPVLKKKIESQREIYATAGEFEKSMNWMVAKGHDALGWVLFAMNRVEEAEKELLTAYEMNHEDRLNLHHLGKFYETKNNIPFAEGFYVKSLGVQALGVNPSEAALKALFEKKSPGAEGGFDKYLEGIREADRERRRTKVIGERLPAPKATPAFNLKDLDGKSVTLESLKGKVVAINFWGIWCGWCVHELPDFQKLYDKYKADPDVVILTIDNDRNPSDVPPWMKEKKFTFPVLLDDGFVSKAGITAFPTTWFIDREGKTAFVKTGWSEKLLEEFSWRIDAIKK